MVSMVYQWYINGINGINGISMVSMAYQWYIKGISMVSGLTVAGAGSREREQHQHPSRIEHIYVYTRALSLRNLVSGYECGRVFPASVGPGSPSRDAINWLPSRSGLLVETRWRYGWLRIVFPGVRSFRAPIWCPSGGWRHARGREHCRGEPGSALPGGYAPVSAKAEGSSIVDEPGEG